jgi:two-component system response regulator YesN
MARLGMLSCTDTERITTRLVTLLANPRDMDRRVHHALARIQSGYEDAGLSAGSLADEVRLTRYHFSRLFNQSLCCSFPLALTAVRLLKARELLTREPFLSVKEVSARVGFRSTSTMDRAFRRGLGIVPSDVRQLR